MISLSKKTAPTTAHNTSLPIILVKKEQYSNENYLYNIANSDSQCIISCDEMGLILNHKFPCLTRQLLASDVIRRAQNCELVRAQLFNGSINL